MTYHCRPVEEEGNNLRTVRKCDICGKFVRFDLHLPLCIQCCREDRDNDYNYRGLETWNFTEG